MRYNASIEVRYIALKGKVYGCTYKAERRAALHDALARFGQNDRALFYRKYYYLQSTAQIAAELGMTERAVEGRLYRLKKRLRTMLGGDGDA